MRITLPTAAPTLGVADQLNVQLLAGLRRNAYVIVACGALGILSGIGYGFSAEIHAPVVLNAAIVLLIGATATVRHLKWAERGLFWVNYGLFAYLALVSHSLTTVVLFVPMLAYCYFVEHDLRYRAVATAAVYGVCGVLYVRFWPDTNFGLSGERMQIEALTDCLLAAVFTGIFVRAHSTYMRLVIEAARRKRGELAARVAEAEAVADVLEQKRLRLAELGLETRRALDAERALGRQLLSRQEQLQQFAYAASHDLKEPVRTVRSFLQVVRKRLAPEVVAGLGLGAAFDAVQAHAEGMHEVLERLLLYSRAGAATDDAPQTQLAGALRRGLARSAANPGEVELAFDPAAIAETVAVGIPEGDLVLVVGELVDNAVRFRQNGRVAFLSIGCSVGGDGFAEVRFRDRGIGIATNELERVFAIFQRLHSREAYPGAGLGLSIVLRVVKAHGGSVSLTSELGVGTEVTLRLPLATAAEPRR